MKQPTLIKPAPNVGNSNAGLGASNGINQSGISSNKIANRLSINPDAPQIN